jgi:membrane protease YdiL (CAAX protease family)
MYIPAIIVLILYAFVWKNPILRNNDLAFRFTGWKYWVIAPFLMAGLSLLSVTVSWIIEPNLIESGEAIRLSLSSKGLFSENIYIGLAIVFLLNLVIGSLLNIPMFLGEELGWRGFLVPRLIRLAQPKYAFLAGGIIWALWHTVMIRQGLNYPGHPIAGVFMMILLSVPLGIIIQYLYFKSGSVFTAALAHAGLNKTSMSISFILNKEYYDPFLYGPTGIVGIIIFWIVALYLYKRTDWKELNRIM